jgi:hypothetical protein
MIRATKRAKWPSRIFQLIRWRTGHKSAWANASPAGLSIRLGPERDAASESNSPSRTHATGRVGSESDGPPGTAKLTRCRRARVPAQSSRFGGRTRPDVGARDCRLSLPARPADRRPNLSAARLYRDATPTRIPSESGEQSRRWREAGQQSRRWRGAGGTTRRESAARSRGGPPPGHPCNAAAAAAAARH